eukprot:TRINITY_DN5654_c0_g1_i1.p3 TRINITY_DN5654_c0_g1~~TRINITY_DN5654_c0_g1_i1.p3  ORF type:complete len:339 (+),score=32.29 TRINITY_DN5654_c0_g1_i1:641-1657(+)
MFVIYYIEFGTQIKEKLAFEKKKKKKKDYVQQVGMLFTLIGGAIVAVYIAKFLIFGWRQFLRPKQNLKQYGSWAVVTGGTDGIGKAYANELAKNGLNICIVARNQEKLTAACEEIEQKYQVQTANVKVDLATPTEQDWQTLELFFNSKDVGILINNAGLSYEHAEYLHLMDPERIDNIISINATTLTQLCRLAIGPMQTRKKGCIVNVSSGTGTFLSTCPMVEVYAATKNYVQHLSKSLADAYAGQGIKIQVISPAFVTTKMSKIRRTSLWTPNPQAYARAAVKHIGYESDSYPYWTHAIQAFVLQHVPRPVLAYAVTNMHKDLRRRAYKKKEQKKDS